MEISLTLDTDVVKHHGDGLGMLASGRSALVAGVLDPGGREGAIFLSISTSNKCIS